MKYLTLFTTLTFFACCPGFLAEARGAAAAAYAVADCTSGHILESDGLSRKLQIGSLTKIATAMVVLDWVDVARQDLNALATVPSEALWIGGNNNAIGFQSGDQVTLRDLLYAALLQSDNIAAYTLAYHVGLTLPSEESAEPMDLFVAQMNALARKLGMRGTKFLNPHGLDNQESPYSTVRDLVKLSSYAMNNAAFRFFVAQQNRQITRRTAIGGTATYNLANTNELLGQHSIDGVKTGKTIRAGECVIISAAKTPESVQKPDGTYHITPRRLVVVVLGARNRFTTALGLLNHGWSLYEDWAAMGRPL